MNAKEFEIKEEKISKFLPYDQHQEWLLPKSVQDYIPENHIARTISDIIDHLDISCIITSYDHKGAPPYHPGMMVKILVYPLLIGLRSSRKIAALLKDSLVFMYLSGRQTPDFRTICRFRRHNLKNIEEIFEQVVRIGVELDMVGLKDVFSDGSKIKANASVKNSKTAEKIEKEISKLKEEVLTMLKEAEEVDKLEDQLYGNENPYTGEGKVSSLVNRIEKLENVKEMIKEKEKEKINTTDTDANIMQFSDKTKKPAYNGEIAVDAKENIILACNLTDEATDHNQLKPLADAVMERVGKPENWGGDAGFFSYDNAEYLKEKKITGYIPDNFLRIEEKKKTKWLRKSKFTYNEETDSYTCPAGSKLFFSHIQKRNGKPDVRVYKATHCTHCPLKEKCTKGKFRTISRDPREHLLDAMRKRVKTEKGTKMKKKRSTTVEPIFGNMKYNKKFTHFLLRGKEKVTIEFVLLCTALNIEKIFNYITTHQIDLTTALKAVT